MNLSPIVSQIVSYAAVPAGCLLFAGTSTVLFRAATYLREKTHNELLARVAEAASRAAADGAMTLANLPAGADFQAAKRAVVEEASARVRVSMADSIRRLGPGLPVPLAVSDIVTGEMGKLFLASPGTPQPMQAVKTAAEMSAPAPASATR